MRRVRRHAERVLRFRRVRRQEERVLSSVDPDHRGRERVLPRNERVLQKCDAISVTENASSVPSTRVHGAKDASVSSLNAFSVEWAAFYKTENASGGASTASCVPSIGFNVASTASVASSTAFYVTSTASGGPMTRNIGPMTQACAEAGSRGSSSQRRDRP